MSIYIKKVNYIKKVIDFDQFWLFFDINQIFDIIMVRIQIKSLWRVGQTALIRSKKLIKRIFESYLIQNLAWGRFDRISLLSCSYSFKPDFLCWGQKNAPKTLADNRKVQKSFSCKIPIFSQRQQLCYHWFKINKLHFAFFKYSVNSFISSFVRETSTDEFWNLFKASLF